MTRRGDKINCYCWSSLLVCVGGMGMVGSATVGYGSINVSHNGMMAQQGHQGIAGNGAMDGNTGYAIY